MGLTGAEIRERRQARGWSQQRLAEKSGLTFSTISRIETGKVRPQRNNLRAIEEALSSPAGKRPGRRAPRR